MITLRNRLKVCMRIRNLKMNRREVNRAGAGIVVICAALLAPRGTKLVYRSAPSAVSNATPIPNAAQANIPTSLLEPASEPPDWTVQKDYSTATVVPQAVAEECVIKVYPNVPSSESAYTGVLRTLHSDTEPNHMLVQRFAFRSEAAATEAMPLLRDEVRNVSSQKFLFNDPLQLTVDETTAKTVSFAHIASNGAAFAILIEQHEAIIYVFRASQTDTPPIEFLRTQSEIFSTAVWVSDPAQLNNWDVPGWRWSYGPINIHPSNYSDPVCT